MLRDDGKFKYTSAKKSALVRLMYIIFMTSAYPMGFLAEWKSLRTRSTSGITLQSTPSTANDDLGIRKRNCMYHWILNNRTCHNTRCHLAAITGAIMLVFSHPCQVTATYWINCICTTIILCPDIGHSQVLSCPESTREYHTIKLARLQLGQSRDFASGNPSRLHQHIPENKRITHCGLVIP